MTDAMRDAELFADAILDATGGLPEAVALARYQAIRGSAVQSAVRRDGGRRGIRLDHRARTDTAPPGEFRDG